VVVCAGEQDLTVTRTPLTLMRFQFHFLSIVPSAAPSKGVNVVVSSRFKAHAEDIAVEDCDGALSFGQTTSTWQRIFLNSTKP
jgi:hypothetical protein